MKLTVPGLDGWRVLELKQLPKAAWDERARVLEIGAETGEVPVSYTHVGTPMMAKVKHTDEAMQHRGLAIFSVLYRIESSAWYEKLKVWQDGWIHPNVHGARGGHETLSSAWPAQARIEAAVLYNQNRSAATLDYSRMFDMFDPNFYIDMMEFMGMPKTLGGMLRDLYHKLIRHTKIAGTYGHEIAPTTGMGQGCSTSLLAANATVNIEYYMLDAVAPEVAKEAFIDDRTLDAHDCEDV